ncbi:uncharacterized protein H6S33_002401 [Morchella sextelata]|uniref:uncharacterized protein n=1 Tax=Morchella sextelata TaxID=1174677 RepID=UPI001D0598A1|nr:uncharacterized protein H6S33_002401 [Morchella sextelata]KAH0607367.1 hypothetical protein H6S33_002401 [Morchella sextelata]
MSPKPKTPAESLRLACRANTHTTSTSLLAPTIQANLLVLPTRYAPSFRALCARNPVSCPLLWTTPPGTATTPLAAGADLRTDLPKYNIYVDGVLQSPRGVLDIREEWSGDHVGFLIGCSYSFETALERAGLPPKHTLCVPARTVPMFRTTVPLCPAGVFTGGVMVVSMRAYPAGRVEEVRDITRRFGRQHGEPVAWGWEGAERLGIAEKVRGGKVDFGEWVEVGEGEVPVFWGCGVTPQVAVMESRIEGVVLSHFPGCMFVSDVPAEDEAGLESVIKILDVAEEVCGGGED